MQNSKGEILSFSDLSIGYPGGRGKKILLPPISACARKGELIAVIGRNGIGKSTLLRTLAGLQAPLGGEIRYAGITAGQYSRNELARITGYISTELVRVANMRVHDLVSLGRYPYTNWTGRTGAADELMIADALARTGMPALSGRFISELSDGERQKAMIARLIAQDTGIMIMDEPTAFLDIGSKFDILHLLHKLTRDNGKTIIFSTHDLSGAMSQADKIWLIPGDRLIEGAPEDLLLQGAFEHLFDSAVVRYNPEHGTYAFRHEEHGVIRVSGEGSLYHYTRKALNRAGYGVARGEGVNFLKVPDSSCRAWQFVSDSHTDEFSSLYDLLAWLRKEGTELI